MRKLTSIAIALFFGLALSTVSAEPADPAEVILGNDGRFNAAPGICFGFPDFVFGQCVKFVQEFHLSPPACDGHLHTDSLACGNPNTEE